MLLVASFITITFLLCFSVYNLAMNQLDNMALFAPWLERWGIPELDSNSTWLQAISQTTFAVDDYLVHAGDVDDTLYLLQTGLVRLFYTTSDGRERNKAFFRPGQLTGPVSAAMTGSAAPFSIQALEPVKALSFPYEAMALEAQNKLPIARAAQQMLAEAFIRNEQREAMLLTCNAEQRYQWLLDNEADLPQRVAQFQIASYLGIDPVSLSRLKRKNSQ
jgi:CRP-like cAMP-binding protein